MPRLSRGWFVALGLIAIVALVLLWRSCRPSGVTPERVAEGISADGVGLVSPDLELELIEVRGKANPGYTEWACIFRCLEAGGCRAETRIRLQYVSGGEKQTLTLAGRLDAARGEKMRVGRMQRPPVTVDRIVNVTVEVTAPYKPGAPRPTPVQ